MENCWNCKHITSRDICCFCDINGVVLKNPAWMGGSAKCECYERRIKAVNSFPYPTKQDMKHKDK